MSLPRLLDAALNRAREAARSAEDYARFVAERPAEAAALKDLRHELGLAQRRVPPSARDVAGDALKHRTTREESRRASPDEAAAASLKRLQEALRSLEEFGKPADTRLSRLGKRLRFEAYRIEAELFEPPALQALKAARLYAVLSPALMPHEPVGAAAAALRGGVEILQLRLKGKPDREVLSLARLIASLCRDKGVPFFLNDRPDLALACGADGVHVGQSDLPPGKVRELFARRLLVGVSTHTVRQIREACTVRPDYLAVGPVFPTLTKPRRGAIGLSLLRHVPAGAPPAFAIGGIEASNLRRVLAAGSSRIAVTGAVFRAADPAAAARCLLKSLSIGRGVR